MRVAFWDNCLCERGTTVVMFEYAYYNKHILGNESLIFFNKNRPDSVPDVVSRFEAEFRVYPVDTFSDVDKVFDSLGGGDVIYITKGGENDGQFSRKYKTVIHCVFNCNHPHGSVYASISPWVLGNDGKYPVVPYMVNIPRVNTTLRDTLKIPTSATVFGRHGGYDQFDLPPVYQVVAKVALENPNIYFIFVNTRPFYRPLKNLIYLPKIIDLVEKATFINTCDAMLWARSGGETFGLAIAEFSTLNKPVIAAPIGDLAHVHLLGDKGLWYKTTDELTTILTQFDREAVKGKDWNAYKDYTPEKVIKQFEKVFLS